MSSEILDKPKTYADVMQDYFYAFNRDPFTAKNLFQHFVTKVIRAGFEIETLELAVKELAEKDGALPQINTLLAVCRKNAPVPQTGAVRCIKCGGHGLVYGVFQVRKDGSRNEVSGSGHVTNPESVYSSAIIGRCDCLNARAFEMSVPEVAQPPHQILKDAELNGWDCAFQSQATAYEHNKKNRPGRKQGPLAKSLESLIARCEANAIEDTDLKVGQNGELF